MPPNSDRRFREYPPPTDEQLRLFAAHQGIVRLAYARLGATWRSRRAGCEPADLWQAGLIGLWQATYAWDPDRASFSTCAYTRVVGAMLDEVDRARYGRVRRRRTLIDHSAMTELPDED
jgi:DNA-directed RNA polymerase specialized sigma subunit